MKFSDPFSIAWRVKHWFPIYSYELDCWQSVFSRNFSSDYEERLFSLKENGKRQTTLPRLLLYTANAICVRDD